MTASTFDPRHPLKSLVVPRDALRPPSSDNPRLGAALSLVAHGGLIAALALGVQWHTQEPEGVTAELWAAVPEIAAPPRVEPQPEPEAVAPPPPPPATPPQPTAAEREAEIAVEQARQDKLEKERREAQDQKAREKRQREEKERKEQEKKQADKERQEREQAEAKQREKDKQAQLKQDQAAAAAREKARQDQLKRINDQLGGNGATTSTSTGTAARDAGPSASYAGRIIARVRPNIQLLFEVDGNPTTDVRLTVMPDGTITRSEVVKSSGVKEWDDAVLRAIEKTAVLPRDENGRVPSPMTISFSPRPRN
ncbi:MAG: cell envelope integrity protein TolA [Burkholderiaceae bacterium]